MGTRTVPLFVLVLLFTAGAWSCIDDSARRDDETGTDGDTDGDADTDIHVDTDTEDDQLPAMLDCDGGKLDPLTDLCWQDSPIGGYMNWDSAISYCAGLVLGGNGDWRLPDIEELLSLLRGCVDGTATGDLSPSACSMTPAGCGAADACDGVISCDPCAGGNGPGIGGYYQDPALGSVSSAFWSSSSSAYSTGNAWVVRFQDGEVYSQYKTHTAYAARCVRDGP